MNNFCAVWFQLLAGIVTPFLLQTIALFSNMWVVKDGVKKGLFYKALANGTHEMSVADTPTLGLACTSFSLLFIFALVSTLTVLCFGPDSDGDITNDSDDSCICCCASSFYCGIALYIIAGILSFSACVRFGAVYPIADMGASFYMYLSSFLIILLVVVVLVCDLLCKKENEDYIFKALLQEVYADCLD